MRNRLYLLLVFAGILISCGSYPALPTVPLVDLKKYSGTWYEIARITHSFEKGLICVTATYGVLPDGRISVLNQGREQRKPEVLKQARGTAWVPDAAFPGRLKVTFFRPFSGNYYIVYLDSQYRHVLVGDPSRDYLWILSRKPIMDQATYDRLIAIARKHGFDTGRLERIEQNCKQGSK